SSGVTTVNFEGATTSTWILSSGSYNQSGVTITQTTNNAFLSDPTYTPYYYNWGTGDVINTPYNGVLTVSFAVPVTAFALDLGSFYDDNNPATPCCAASTFYGKDVIIGTSQGNFTVDLNSTQTMKFFGLTSDTAFTSFTITGVSVDAFASTVLDNVRYGTAAAVPEPATWGMMIAGFGLLGAAMRRRATKIAYAA
ncbi:PEPxxWA-CTERM sorting domain-containing protein, partial [Sphingomonas sp.]|uniref:PEPxxWA-CTERM sorting domain-containing protein n=1 Tax=Sphingomonas sp. TaxID=28214 RepID=UPI0025D187CA